MYGLYGLEHHIVETNGEGCHKCAHTDTHSEYSVNPRLVDSDSQKNNWHGVVSAFDEGN